MLCVMLLHDLFLLFSVTYMLIDFDFGFLFQIFTTDVLFTL